MMKLFIGLILFSFIINFIQCDICPLTQEPPQNTDYSPQACLYSEKTCCPEGQDSKLNSKLTSSTFVNNYGDSSKCCHKRVNDLLCGQQCSPHANEYVKRSNHTDAEIMTVCPRFCNETFNICKNNVVEDGGYMRSIEDIMTMKNPSDPAAAFCQSFSTDSQFLEMEVQQGTDDSSACFDEELSSCDTISFDKKCPGRPDVVPQVRNELKQCGSFNGQESCCTNEQDSSMNERFVKGGIVDYFFGPSGDCCLESIRNLFCGFNCGTSGSLALDTTMPNDKGIRNVTVYACETYCEHIYQVCKDKDLVAGSTVEQIMSSRNPGKPHQAMCHYLSSSQDPSYQASKSLPYVQVNMRSDDGFCLNPTAPNPPECEINKEREEYSSESKSSKTAVISVSTLLVMMLLIV
eukprot:gb/GECH01014114.1/.p1 GENE.gb/GECH01014114.1/~~gb/GECH01014114.1/.p1  ORF type:complete len:405 (+),score=78.41 gb/GECH01014114.1/:1-1215(+)